MLCMRGIANLGSWNHKFGRYLQHFGFHPFSHGCQRCLNSVHWFLDDVQWIFHGCRDEFTLFVHLFEGVYRFLQLSYQFLGVHRSLNVVQCVRMSKQNDHAYSHIQCYGFNVVLRVYELHNMHLVNMENLRGLSNGVLGYYIGNGGSGLSTA